MKGIAPVVVAILAAGGPSSAQPVVSPASAVSSIVASPDACAGGLVPDDGSAETGYGWVPSVVDGIYVQEVDSSELPNSRLMTVCVCWLRTQADDEIDFELVFYAQEDGRPQAAPYASVPASAAQVPVGVTGRFYEVPVAGIDLAPGVSYVGVRWVPAKDSFFFVCTDTSPATAPVEAFFIDDRAEDWVSVFEARDPIFDDHRALMIRLEARPAEVPTLPGPGLLVLVLALAAAGVAASRAVRSR